MPVPYSFYDDRRARDFVAATFSKLVLDMYEAFPLGVMRADFWR
jgi:mannosyltransferase OCH1-like enzyme